MSLALDNCSHCACRTEVVMRVPPGTPEEVAAVQATRAVELLERGELGCWNCEDADEDGHTRCVQLVSDSGAVLWDGRCDRR